MVLKQSLDCQEDSFMSDQYLDKPEEAASEYQYVTKSGADPRLVSLANTLLQTVRE